MSKDNVANCVFDYYFAKTALTVYIKHITLYFYSFIFYILICWKANCKYFFLRINMCIEYIVDHATIVLGDNMYLHCTTIWIVELLNDCSNVVSFITFVALHVIDMFCCIVSNVSWFWSILPAKYLITFKLVRSTLFICDFLTNK